MSPHCSAILLQHSRSADVIAAPGNTQAATGSAANMRARAETPTLITSFNITSLSATDSKTQQAGKGFSLPLLRDGQPNVHGTAVTFAPPGESSFTHQIHDLTAPLCLQRELVRKAVVSLLFTFMYFRSSTRRRFPLQFDLIVINGGTDEIF